MNPTAFCFWFKGVLDISEQDGSVSFDQQQLTKVQANLRLALEEVKASNASGRPPKPGNPRC